MATESLQAVVDNCMRLIAQYGVTHIYLYVDGTQYDIATALADQMLTEIQQAIVEPLQFTEFTLNFGSSDYFLAMPIYELSGSDPNVKMKALTQGDNAIIAMMIQSTIIGKKISQILDIIWDTVLIIFKGSY